MMQAGKTMKKQNVGWKWGVGTRQMNDRNREIQTESKTYDGYLSYQFISYNYIIYIYTNTHRT
jgi:hypothetical protein